MGSTHNRVTPPHTMPVIYIEILLGIYPRSMFRTGKIKLNPEISLPFNFLIQKYFFHDSSAWIVNYSEYVFQVGTRSMYSW